MDFFVEIAFAALDRLDSRAITLALSGGAAAPLKERMQFPHASALVGPGSSGVEQRTENPRVGGSIPPLGTISFSNIAQQCPIKPGILRISAHLSSTIAQCRPVTSNSFGGIVGGTINDDALRYPQMALSDAAIRALKPSITARKCADSEGLFIYLTPGGSKLWRWKFRFNSKEKLMAFGSYRSKWIAAVPPPTSLRRPRCGGNKLPALLIPLYRLYRRDGVVLRISPTIKLILDSFSKTLFAPTAISSA